MQSLTNHKLVVDGCAGRVVTHRALAVAEQDLETVTAKTIQRKSIQVGLVPIAVHARQSPNMILSWLFAAGMTVKMLTDADVTRNDMS